MERQEHFGERLRRLRGDRSQKSVAEELGFPQTTLSSLENQQAVPRGELLTKLAQFFGVPIDYFYDESQPRASDSARTWLRSLRDRPKGFETVATHSREPLDGKVRKTFASILKKKNEETKNKHR